MSVINMCAQDVRIAYVGGGSRGWAWKLMADLATEERMSGEVALYDIDMDAAQRNRIIGTRVSEAGGGRWRYSVAKSLESAVAGADFVVVSVLPGTVEEMDADVHMPERLGVLQSVGDTTGPGGVIRALRTIPIFTNIARAVREYAPQAIVINYTNPMALALRALYEEFPGIRAFGCCHEVFNTQQVLAHCAQEMLGLEGVTRGEVHVNVKGLNHFTWFDAASCRGQDLMEAYRAFTDRHFAQGFEEPGKPWDASTFNCAHRVKMDLFRRTGWIAAAGDRHLAEFVPGYLRDRETIAGWKFALTSVAWRKEELKERLARSERLCAGEEGVSLEPSGEEGVQLMRALCGLERRISNVNLPNAGQIPNLPLGCVVETNAVFERGSVRPVFAGALSGSVLEMTMPHALNQEDVLRAALTHDKELVVRAMMRDPVTAASGAKESDVRALAMDMMRATKAYLPRAWGL